MPSACSASRCRSSGSEPSFFESATQIGIACLKTLDAAGNMFREALEAGINSPCRAHSQT